MKYPLSKNKPPQGVVMKRIKNVAVDAMKSA